MIEEPINFIYDIDNGFAKLKWWKRFFKHFSKNIVKKDGWQLFRNKPGSIKDFCDNEIDGIEFLLIQMQCSTISSEVEEHIWNWEEKSFSEICFERFAESGCDLRKKGWKWFLNKPRRGREFAEVPSICKRPFFLWIYQQPSKFKPTYCFYNTNNGIVGSHELLMEPFLCLIFAIMVLVGICSWKITCIFDLDIFVNVLVRT